MRSFIALIFWSSSALAVSVQTLEQISQIEQISYDEAMAMMADLVKEMPAKAESEEQKSEIQVRYNKAHNQLFVLAHLARVRLDLKNIRARHGSHSWFESSREASLDLKEAQLTRLGILLDKIRSGEIFPLRAYDRLSQVSSEISRLTLPEEMDLDFGSNESKLGRTAPSLFGITNPNVYFSQQRHVPLDLDRINEILEAQTSDQFVLSSIIESPLNYETPSHQLLLDPYQARFVRELGGRPVFVMPKFVDLSPFFPVPLQQGRSYACVGFAISSDMDFVLQKIGVADERISPWIAYGNFIFSELGLTVPSCKEIQDLNQTMAEGSWNKDEGVYYIAETLEEISRSETPFCSVNSTGAIGHRYIPGKLHEFYEEITADLIRAMLLNRLPPILLIDSDARESIEDWKRITHGGAANHVFNVVGYGFNEISPFSLKPVPYFIVRDSLGKEDIHYKVPAENLIHHALGIQKITRVIRLLD